MFIDKLSNVNFILVRKLTPILFWNLMPFGNLRFKKTYEFPLIAALTLLWCCPCYSAGEETGYDIVVYGSSSAGVVAAIQAARMGKSVVLISMNRHIGGLTTSGLTATDMDDHASIGGIAIEFYHEIYAHYNNPSVWNRSDREHYFDSIKNRAYTGRNEEREIQWVFESHVAEKIFLRMLKDSGADLVLNEKLNLVNGVEKVAGKIIRITMESGRKFKAKVFIDATYEGDLMAGAGVTYTTGREAISKYDESLAGIRINDVYGFENQSIDPYIIEGDPSSGLLLFIDRQLSGTVGQGDNRTQSYCYRLTLTDDPENRLAITKPRGYNPAWYEYLARRLQLHPELPLRRIMTLTPMPNRKTDTNGIDFVGANYEYADGNYVQREKIRESHRTFALGMLWFLANDTRIPDKIRKEMKQWGLAKDEFQDNENFPYSLYIRESRRMISDYVMTQHNALSRSRTAPYSVGLATYAVDSHRIARFLGADGNVYEEGQLYEISPSYPISYESIRPKKSECTNLLVPVTLSASHVSYGSIRMEPVFMVLGQSAAAAAALSIDHNVSVQDLPYLVLESQLIQNRQILTAWQDRSFVNKVIFRLSEYLKDFISQ